MFENKCSKCGGYAEYVCLCDSNKTTYWECARCGKVYPKENLTIQDVIDAVEHIRRKRINAEEAHMMEDQLYIDVLEAIADGFAEDPKKMAAEALKAVEIDFPRHYA